MGRWFPDIRTGTPEQCAAYRAAKQALNRNGRYEHAAGMRGETERYLDLNDAVARAEGPLSPAQRWWHFQRAAAQEDRGFTRLQQASDRQDRQQRQAGRLR